ncbi:hypothetical protein FAI40_05255 [Acetobacteraceae bacterium]|nr:hypothetical protein FAI40_05255 [Acetobacteraceae bacterium]
MKGRNEMIVCSCNLISDKDVFDAISEGASRPAQIYAHKKCKADCGGCAKQICRLLKEQKNSALSASCPNQETCPNRQQNGCHQQAQQSALARKPKVVFSTQISS